MNDLASQAPMIGPVISAVCAVAVVVILPLLAYIQMRRDKDIDRIVARQDDSNARRPPTTSRSRRSRPS